MFLCKCNNLNFVYLPPMFVEGCCILKPFPMARTADGEINVLSDMGQDAIKIGVMEGAQATKIVFDPARPVYMLQIMSAGIASSGTTTTGQEEDIELVEGISDEGIKVGMMQQCFQMFCGAS